MEWISVKDRLPEFDDPEDPIFTIEVLVYDPRGEMGPCYTAFYSYQSKRWVMFDDNWTQEVTHWMLLPPPPEDKGNVEITSAVVRLPDDFYK